MATVNYLLKSKKNPANLYVRFTHTRKIDIFTPLDIFINNEHWDLKRQKIKNVSAVQSRNEINTKLLKLQVHIFDSFNSANLNGTIIDKLWLQSSIKNFFGRTDLKKDVHHIYFTDFIEYWLKEESSKWITSNQNYLSPSIISQYTNFKKILKNFEGDNKIRMKNITRDLLNEFIQYLIDEGYSGSYNKRQIGRFRFFCLRAEEMNYDINRNFKQKVFVPKDDYKGKEIFLNYDEIDLIYNHKLKGRLDDARDNLIISVWTGLRISDFSRLNTSNINDGYIEINTQKTGASVTIPIHPMIKEILEKRGGEFPASTHDYNDLIKIVCKEVGLNQEVEGAIFNGRTKRKEAGLYKKYELASSHIGRRSFATNHFGKLPNQVIMKICGWSSEQMLMNYIKKSDKSYAIELQKHWENKEK